MYCITCIVDKVEASDGTEAFNLLVAAVNSADERVRLWLNPQKNNSKLIHWHNSIRWRKGETFIESSKRIFPKRDIDPLVYS